MLRDRHVHPTVPAADLARARGFYEQTLGFSVRAERPGGIAYDCADSWFVLYPSASAGTNQATTMGFATDDIEAEVAELKARGVVFEEYDSPNFKTVDSIFSSPANRSAWFKDSEGNIIGVVQFTDPF